MLTGSVTWPAGSRARQVIRVEGDVVAEAVGSDAESQGCPAVHCRCEGLSKKKTTRPSANGAPRPKKRKKEKKTRDSRERILSERNYNPICR